MAGQIALSFDDRSLPGGVDPNDETNAGRTVWLKIAAADGAMGMSKSPVTPGDDFYRFRSILADHALRYMGEHDPGKMRFASAEHTRIQTIAHELDSEEDRARAANTDEFIRGVIGQLWRIIEAFRVMPYGTVERDTAWRARRDWIESIMAPFCEACEGAGMSHRIIRKHPYRDWEKWQKAGLNFVTDRAFEPIVVSRNIVTRASHKSDLRNFVNALDFGAEGHPDDDYSARVFRAHSEVFPGVSTPEMPDFSTRTQSFWRAYMAAAWRTRYEAAKARGAIDADVDGMPDYNMGVIRNWCAANLLVLLDDRNVADEATRDMLEDNSRFEFDGDFAFALNSSFSALNIRTLSFGAVTGSIGLWSMYHHVPSVPAFRDRPGVYLTDGTATTGLERAWSDTAERDKRIALVDQILGDATPGT